MHTKTFSRAFLLALAGVAQLGLAGCASIFEGTTQDIQVNTNPPGADCAFNRQGETIARINETPGGAVVQKTKYDINIVCDKPGYQTATYLDHSGTAGVTFVDVIWWPSAIVDSAAGADNKYDSPVNISLVPNEHPIRTVKHKTVVKQPAPDDDNEIGN